MSDSMEWWTLAALAVALGVDAFAVAVSAGMGPQAVTKRRLFRLSFHFGLFQALMPVIGCILGSLVFNLIAHVDHWIAFGLLLVVGVRMMYDSLQPESEQRKIHDPTKGWDLVMLSIATSIDALAVGLTLALIGATIIAPSIVIGIVAAGMTLLGMQLGRYIGSKLGQRVGILGGIVLIGIGIQIVVQHLQSA